MSYYNSETAAAEYLDLHYGNPAPWRRAFPVRCVAECLATEHLPAAARGLDLGCAVGRGTFELARHCGEVIGIDASRQFIAIANRLRRDGSYRFNQCQEGELTRPQRAVVPKEIERRRVNFEVGDAVRLRAGLGKFCVALMANLIDRVAEPEECLGQLAELLNPGGQLILTSPYTWLLDYTPRRRWLGGFKRKGREVRTFQSIRRILAPHFRLVGRRDLSFLIREHARKFQLGIADASIWLRR
jgi:putative 4-mercaptohistidine N1-methyltranferase